MIFRLNYFAETRGAPHKRVTSGNAKSPAYSQKILKLLIFSVLHCILIVEFFYDNGYSVFLLGSQIYV